MTSTTTIAPIGYEPRALVAYGDGYVLNLSGHLVRLDAAGVEEQGRREA